MTRDWWERRIWGGPGERAVSSAPAGSVPGLLAGVVVGLDLGGTKVLGAQVHADGVIGPAVSDLTPQGGDASRVEDVLDRVVRRVAAGRPVAAVGLAAAGFVDATGSRVVFAPHLPWRDEPVRDRLAVRWSAPVALENDATCAGVAEQFLGAARGAGSMLLVNVGTGIGGALGIGGEVWRGASGMSGEFGHQQVVPDGRSCACGLRGCWEEYVSGPALERAARAGGWIGPGGTAITRAAESGDPVAVAAFETIGRWLGVGLANLVDSFDPAVVVIGGGVGVTGDLLLDPARAALAEHLVGGPYRTPPPVLAAGFGTAAGLVGAGLLAHRLV